MGRKFIISILGATVTSLYLLSLGAWVPSQFQHSNTRLSLSKEVELEQLPRKLADDAAKPHSVEVFVQHDNYAEDTAWTLKDLHGNLVASRNSTADEDGEGKSIVTPVAAGVYTFELTDNYGDGLCCKEGQFDGHYKLTANGKVIAIGGEFADTTGPVEFKIYNNGLVTTTEHTNLGLQPYCLEDDPKKYDICLYLTTKTAHFRNDWLRAFHNAKKKWETIIVGDSHPAVDFEEGSRAWQQPSKLDDIYISGEAAPIDGPYKVLGSSGPRTMLTIEKVNNLNNQYFKQTLTGEMTFDSADISRMMEEGTYEDVIVHEMGHVLGIGTMWSFNGLHSGKDLDPLYKGVNAQREFHALGFPGKLEVEVDHGPGTAGGHWDEECLRTEVMTGIADKNMQFSRVTVAGMEDLGYDVNYSAADPFSLPPDMSCGHQDPKNPDARVRKLMGKNSRRRKLSNEGREEAVKYGESLIAQSLKEIKNMKLAKGETYIAHQVRQVLYEEEGQVYSVQVRASRKV